MLALENVRVLDLSLMPPAHFMTSYLSDFGAEVIRIVAVPNMGKANNPVAAIPIDEKALAGDFFNRNKKCIALNLKSPQGKEVFLKLAETADVIVEGGRPGGVKRMGIDYESVKKINPRIVYCSMSGFGQEGPYSLLAGHDINYIAYAGLLSILGQLDGPPAIPSNFMADFAGAGMHGVIGITMALLAREKTGKGQFVDISYTDAALALNSTNLGAYLQSGITFDIGANPFCGLYPAYSVYQTKDNKWLSLGCFEPWFWEKACKVMEVEEYQKDGALPMEAFFSRRPSNPKIAEARKAIQDKIKTRTRDEWVELLQKNDIPAAPVLDMAEVASDPHMGPRMVIEVEVPGVGKLKQPGFPIKLSETPAQFIKRAPGMGENTVEVLKSAGYTDEHIDQMRQAGAIA